MRRPSRSSERAAAAQSTSARRLVGALLVAGLLLGVALLSRAPSRNESEGSVGPRSAGASTADRADEPQEPIGQRDVATRDPADGASTGAAVTTATPAGAEYVDVWLETPSGEPLVGRDADLLEPALEHLLQVRLVGGATGDRHTRQIARGGAQMVVRTDPRWRGAFRRAAAEQSVELWFGDEVLAAESVGERSTEVRLVVAPETVRAATCFVSGTLVGDVADLDRLVLSPPPTRAGAHEPDVDGPRFRFGPLAPGAYELRLPIDRAPLREVLADEPFGSRFVVAAGGLLEPGGFTALVEALPRLDLGEIREPFRLSAGEHLHLGRVEREASGAVLLEFPERPFPWDIERSYVCLPAGCYDVPILYRCTDGQQVLLLGVPAGDFELLLGSMSLRSDLALLALSLPVEDTTRPVPRVTVPRPGASSALVRPRGVELRTIRGNRLPWIPALEAEDADVWVTRRVPPGPYRLVRDGSVRTVVVPPASRVDTRVDPPVVTPWERPR